MEKIVFQGQEISYLLTRKKVKNINVRIKSNKVVYVSANPKVPKSEIERFLHEKAAYILICFERFDALEQEKLKVPEVLYTKKECLDYYKNIAEKIYPVFENLGIPFPKIFVRSMVSRWGSCIPAKNKITLNTKLMAAPAECIEYVIFHEFAHFIHPNHSKEFYHFIEHFMPDYRERKKKLDKITCRT